MSGECAWCPQEAQGQRAVVVRSNSCTRFLTLCCCCVCAVFLPQRHPFFANFRINGSSHPIPIPPHFPPPRTRPAVHPTGSPMESDSASSSARGSASGSAASEHRSEKEERRARKAAEVEARNERHMLEQVCRLLVHRGMTSRPAASASGTPATSPPSAASPVPSPPRAVPIDPKLCERICDRLAALLKVSAAAVRPILTHTHNQFVGLA